MPARPNLVVFLPDQQRADTLTPSIAPHLAKLAQESTVFERAFVTQPVCTPSRSSIMTGTWPHQNGCTHNSVALPRHLKCLPQLVEGYEAAYFGKWHLGRESEAQRGFQHWISTEGLSDYSRFLLTQGYQPDCTDGSFSARFVSGLPEEISKPHFLAEHARRFIHENRHRPFILFVAFVEPHSP
ncbi:MAG: sulfatase-like hydrolase/transferase, partial [Verrucomicrobiota bacterium]